MAMDSGLEPGERRQIRLMAWALAVINVCIVGIGLLVACAAEAGLTGLWMVVGLLLVVNLAFGLIVGGNVVVVRVGRWWRGRSARARHSPRGGDGVRSVR